MEKTYIDPLKIDIENYSGPLDVLLELAKLQKVDLANISITQLADQFLEFIHGAKKLNLNLALDYLLMATWLAYLKSKLLLPQYDEDSFEVSEVAKKLKLQLKRLELIRLLSDQLLKRKRLGMDIHMRGITSGIRSINSPTYAVTLYEVLKAYANHKMKRNLLSISIPKLPLLTTEEGIETIRKNLTKLKNWKNISELIPKKFYKSLDLKKTGFAGIFAASLELTKEGLIKIMQEKLFSEVLIKEKNEQG